MKEAYTLRGRQAEVHEHFSNLGDYLWKLPRFIESEIEIEREKLFSYFPDSADPEIDKQNKILRRFRFDMEFGKLLVDFPDFMACSALVMVVSQFEYYLLQIARDHEIATEVAMAPFRTRDRGVGGLLAYLSTVHVAWKPHPKLEQVRHALTLRNCVAHANGVLTVSKDAEKIRKIVKERLYYPPPQRKDSKTLDDQLRLVETSVGERLGIPILYPHWLCYAARDLLISISLEAPLAG